MDTTDLAAKLGRLVRERGWNQEDFARAARLNRHTVRKVLQGTHPLRNSTVESCARALGLTVSDLHDQPLAVLLARLHGRQPADGEGALQRVRERAVLPGLAAWAEENAGRLAELSPDELEELLGEQGPHGRLARLGVERFVELLERRRRVVEQVRALADTERFGLLEEFVGVLYEQAKAVPTRWS